MGESKVFIVAKRKRLNKMANLDTKLVNVHSNKTITCGVVFFIRKITRITSKHI